MVSIGPIHRIHRFAILLVIGLIAFATGAAKAAEPFLVGPGSRVCIGNTDDTSISDSDEADALVLNSKFAKATAVGRFATEHSATAEAGIHFRPIMQFDGSITVVPQYNGVLNGGGPSITNRSNFRVDLVLRDLTDGVDVVDIVDEAEQTSGSATIVQDLFTPEDGTVSATFMPDHEYELVLRLNVRARGLGTEADFITNFKGATYDCLTFETTLTDADGDGIYDVWEEVGIDIDGDGEPDLPADGLGVDYRGEPIVLDPEKKDILVEIDYFDCAVDGGDCEDGDAHSHRPTDEALDAVREAFSDAPVGNPGEDGINLWIVRDGALAHRDYCNLDVTCYDDLKPNNFAAEDASDPVRTAARRLIFHYSLWAHKQGDPDSDFTILGLAEKPGNDLLISLGGWNGDTGTPFDQAATFMHELGHNLDLDHGGSDEVNCKPNYLSIMSYTWGATGLVTQPTQIEGLIDYARETNPSTGSVDEGAPDESLGIEDGSFITFYGPPADLDGVPPLDWRVGQGTGPIDWDGDGTPDEEEGDAADLNDLDVPDCGPSPGQTLVGHDDWPNLLYNFRGTDNFLIGVHDVVPESFDFDTAERIRERIWWSGVRDLHEYSGKLICGIQDDDGDFSFTRGGYATSINIHNPGRDPVTFFHKLALSMPGRDTVEQRIYPLGFLRLAYDEAHQVDCNGVRDALFPDGLPEGFIEGYLVVQSATSVDVTGVYTTAALNENGRPRRQSSIDVERIEERITSLGRPDLVIPEFNLDFRCDPPAPCTVDGNVTIANIGDEDAGVFQVNLRIQPAGMVLDTILIDDGLAAGDSRTEPFEASFEPEGIADGSRLCIGADLPANQVAERNEENNEQCVGLSLP